MCCLELHGGRSLVLKGCLLSNIFVYINGYSPQFVLKSLGFKCEEVAEYNGFKEMLDGRVKTLHPKIHAGILNDRKHKQNRTEMSKQNFPSITLIN